MQAHTTVIFPMQPMGSLPTSLHSSSSSSQQWGALELKNKSPDPFTNQERKIDLFLKSPFPHVPFLTRVHVHPNMLCSAHVHPKRFEAVHRVPDWRARVLIIADDYVVVDKPPGVQVIHAKQTGYGFVVPEMSLFA